jgi:hypothetical protein
MKTIHELCDRVRETSYSIHIYHGHGRSETKAKALRRKNAKGKDAKAQRSTAFSCLFRLLGIKY